MKYKKNCLNIKKNIKMSILKILQYPNKNLRKKAQNVSIVNKKIFKIIKDMFETMNNNNGIGLAATQVNIHLKIIVINQIHKITKPLILINPKIIKKNKIILSEEGCLSIPEKYFQVPRYNFIKVQSFNQNGELQKIKAKSTLSFCIQHEIDHLKGKLILDY